MNIVYIHQYFATPQEAEGTRSYWIAQELIKHGHTVTMLTSSSEKDTRKTPVDIDGIKVIYIKVPYNQKMGIYKRLCSFIKFMYKSTKTALKQKEIDLTIATSTPLTIGFPALIVKWFKKIPYVFEVRDLWPEVPIQMGALKNPILIKLSKSFEKTIYKQARHIVALSPGMQDGVMKYVPKEKVSMIPNMSKIDIFKPREINTNKVLQLGLKEDSFKIIHFGSMGLANGLDGILNAAALLKDDVSIEFVFVGGGSQEEILKQKVEEFSLENVKFLGKYPLVELSEIVNLCDVSIVSFKNLPILYTNSPNKLFDSLSAGKPIIVNSAGWTKELVEKHKCGVYVNPNNARDFVTKIKFLQNNQQVLLEMGNNSRKLAETEYDKSILCDKFAKLINNILNFK